ncbi:MAG: AAA family ATPase [Treponema sp.]|nr:AAA family ATPase [Treponema sp.]
MYNDVISSGNQAVSRISGRNPYYLQDSDEEEKKIEGKSLEDCKAKLYNLYGTNYKITGQKQSLKGGFFGWGQKETVEVRYIPNPKPISSPSDAFQKSRDEILSNMTGNGSVTNVMQLSMIDKKLEETQKTLDEKMNLLIQATKAADKPASIAEIEDILQKNEFTFEYINKITTRLRSELTMEQLGDSEFVQKTVFTWIGESIKITPNIPYKYPHVIILVGPTGVGKTTTIAKMAGTLIKEAKDKNQPKPAIKMITIDHTRVGAEEQLRRFGDILMIDVYKAESSDDVKKIFEEYKDKLDVLFIDTPGYSPNDSENIGKMRKVLEVKGIHPDVYLTFSAATKARDLMSIIRNYENCNYNSVIITKWDETSAIGNVISVLSKKEKSVSFITDGQQVPRKIENASVLRFLTFLDDFDKVDRAYIDEKFPEDK